jgi:AcrR family transcriptional regulator
MSARRRELVASLPRGPHTLTRAEVERSQRERLLSATIDAVAHQGYVRTSVADIIDRAGVSRATFYEQFRDKEECFVAAYRDAAEHLAAAMADEVARMEADGPAEPLARLERVLALYLDSLQAAPTVARVFLIDVYAAGPAAIEQRRVSMERFVDVVAATHRGQRGVLGTRARQRFAAQALVGAVSSMVTNLIGVGDAERLSELRRPLMKVAAQFTASPGP